MKNLYEAKGITLIALIITIIILIILAGITISLVIDPHGIVQKAKLGAQNYQDAVDEEKKALEDLSDTVNNINRDPNYAFDYNENSTDFGNDTSTYDWSGKTGTEARLDLGETVNLRLKKIAALANGVSEDVVDTYTVYNTEDTYIRVIEWWTGDESTVQKVKYGQLAMTDDSILGVEADGTTNELIVSDVPIWAWYDNGTIYIWSSDSTITMHPHSERMFQGMKNMGFSWGGYTINKNMLNHLVADNVTSMRCMFRNTSAFDQYLVIFNSWNLTNVKKSLKEGYENLPGNNGFYHIFDNFSSNFSGNRRDTIPKFNSREGLWDSEGTYFPTITKAMAYDIGDEVTIGNENFYVIEYCEPEQNEIKVITKYPLNISGTAQVLPEQMTNYFDRSSYAVPFSSEIYWEDEWDTFYQLARTEVEWNNNYDGPADWSHIELNLNNVSGYSASDAIGKTKTYTASIGGSDGRLLTLGEYEDLASQNGGYRSRLDNSLYWLGSASYSGNKYIFFCQKYQTTYNDGSNYGVRPVLTLPRSSITLVKQNTDK